MEMIGLALAVVVGLSLGLLGGGGSILTVPIFVYVLGFDAKQAIAMSLPVVGVTSLVGAAGHWRNGNVRAGTALVFGGIAMLGAFAGARLAALLSGAAQLTMLAVVMLAAAGAMLRGTRPTAAPLASAPDPGMSVRLTAVAGFAVGVLTGVIGIGGGFLVVPALVLLGGLPMPQAVGTSLLVIAMNSAAGFVGYLGRVDLPWAFTARFAALAIAGILAGASLVRFVPQAALKRAFALFLLAVGALMLHQNRAAFHF